MQTPLSTSKARRFSQLSTGRQILVRLCQQTNFGSIRGLELRGGEPVFDSPPTVQVDLRLDSDEPPRPETQLSDFELSRELLRLLDRLDDGNTTAIELLEIRAGIPRRAVFRTAMTPGISDRQATVPGAKS